MKKPTRCAPTGPRGVLYQATILRIEHFGTENLKIYE
jgi:hypothetical protein